MNEAGRQQVHTHKEKLVHRGSVCTEAKLTGRKDGVGYEVVDEVFTKDAFEGLTIHRSGTDRTIVQRAIPITFFLNQCHHRVFPTTKELTFRE